MFERGASASTPQFLLGDLLGQLLILLLERINQLPVDLGESLYFTVLLTLLPALLDWLTQVFVIANATAHR